jgi:hypothetical protein
MGTDLLGKTDGKERDRLIPAAAVSALMGTLFGGGATHALSNIACATAKAAQKVRPRIDIGIPQEIFGQSIAEAKCSSSEDTSNGANHCYRYVSKMPPCEPIAIKQTSGLSVT